MGLAKELITITTSIHSKWNICILLEKGQQNIYKYKYPINLDIVSNLLYFFFCPHTHLEWGKKPYHTSQYQNALVNSKFTLRSYIHFLYEIYIRVLFILFFCCFDYILCINIFPISILHYSNWTGKHKKMSQNKIWWNSMPESEGNFFFLLK